MSMFQPEIETMSREDIRAHQLEKLRWQVKRVYENVKMYRERMYEAYAGSYCPITPGVDVIMVVEAKEGKVEDVKAKLEQRKAEIVAANENYVGSLLEKAKEGRIVVKGNVVVLVIAGDEMVVEDQGVAKAYEPVDAAIEEAFK